MIVFPIAGFYFPTSGSRDIHTGGHCDHSCLKGLKQDRADDNTERTNLHWHLWSSGYHTADLSSPPPAALALLSLVRRGSGFAGEEPHGAPSIRALPPSHNWYVCVRRVHKRVTVDGLRSRQKGVCQVNQCSCISSHSSGASPRCGCVHAAQRQWGSCVPYG